jgi:hypothetical protein
MAAVASMLVACINDPASSTNDSEQDNEVLAASPTGPGAGMDRQLGELRRVIRRRYGVALPPMPIPVNNPQSDKKIALGEALFFDPNLSGCGTIACASCHIPEKGFSDGQQISDGCAGATGRRIRVLGILVGACLLVIAAALATLPLAIEVAGSPANCDFPAFALRAPSEPDDKGFNAVEDACSGAGFDRLFKAFVFGGAGVAAIIGAQRYVRRRAAGVDELE